jgi:hypothetical protein
MIVEVRVREHQRTIVTNWPAELLERVQSGRGAPPNMRTTISNRSRLCPG